MMDIRKAVNMSACAHTDVSKITHNIKDEAYYLFGDVLVNGKHYEIDYNSNHDTIQLYDFQKSTHLGKACKVFVSFSDDGGIDQDYREVKKWLPIMIGTAFGFDSVESVKALRGYLEEMRSIASMLGNQVFSKEVPIEYESLESLTMCDTLTLTLYENGASVEVGENKLYVAEVGNFPADYIASAIAGDIEYLLSFRSSHGTEYTIITDVVTNGKPIEDYIIDLLNA